MDFLVAQVAQQASIEGIPFSDTEKRLLSFAEETSPSEEAELQDSDQGDIPDPSAFQSKVCALLKHGYARAKKENAEIFRLWREAIKELRRADHYFLLLWRNAPKVRPPHDRIKLSVTALSIVVVVGALGFAQGAYKTLPAWLQRSLIAAMIGTYIYAVALPWTTKRPSPGMAWLVAKVTGAFREDGQER